MFRKFFTLIGTAGILIGGIGFIMFMGSLRPKIEPEEPELAPPLVFYATAKAESVTLDVSAQGEVRPRTDINLTAQVSGRVTSISDAFVDGGAFEEGKILVNIEDADYRAAAAGAKARVAQAEEGLRREEAEAALARRDYEDLGRSDAPTDLALRIPQLAQARANFEAARAEYRAAELNLARTAVRAPFQGRVRQRIVGVGQYVAPGAQLGRIFSTDAAEIRLPLTDNDLAKLGLPIAFNESADRPGPPVKLSAFIAGEEHFWDARIARTDGAIDPATRQISAIAVVDDPYGEGADNGTPLAMGLYVDATIEGKPYDNAIMLPRSALYGQNTVYVIADNDTIHARHVRVVSSERDTITISTGVEPGEQVVISPLRGAGDGDKVTPTDPTAISPRAGADNIAASTSESTAATANSGE